MLRLSRFLKSSGLILATGSAVASGLNFYSFVVLPAARGVSHLDSFVRDNYLGGLYLFGVASSVGPLAMFILSTGKRVALSRYVLLSSILAVLIAVGCIGMAESPWSYLCLLAALCMHSAGFAQAALIHQERVIQSSLLTTLQPALFAVFVTMYELTDFKVMTWSASYLSSCLIALAIFAFSTDWLRLRITLSEVPTSRISWSGLCLRMAMSVSFSLFFQLELILFGHFGPPQLGEYAILQKLYSSISISLFGSIGILMLSRHLTSHQNTVFATGKPMLFLAACSALCVLPAGAVVVRLGQGEVLNLYLISISASVAFVFTLSSFLNLKLSTVSPSEAMKLLAASLIAYAVIFFLTHPSTLVAYLSNAGFFFLVYLLLFYIRYHRQEKGQINEPQ